MDSIHLAHLPAIVLSIAKVCVWLALFSAVFVPLERLFMLHPQTVFRRAFAADLVYYFLNSLVPTLVLSVPFALMAWGAHRLVPDGVTAAIAQWPIWLHVAATVLVVEIGFYWGHRWSHQWPWLWRFHAVHHSAEQMDWLVNTRAHPFDTIFSRLCSIAPLYVLGLTAPAVGTVANWLPLVFVLLGAMWGFFIHANVNWRFGPLEFLLTTPGFHHWHHTNDGPAYVDKNFASVLPLMDLLFGTFHLPRGKRTARFGTDYQLAPGLLDQLMDPFLPPRPVLPSAEEKQPTSEWSETRVSAEPAGKV